MGTIADGWTVLNPPEPYNITITCPCGEPIRFVGVHRNGEVHSADCPVCGLRQVWRSDRIYTDRYPDGVWLCYRQEGYEDYRKRKHKDNGDGFWKKLWRSATHQYLP